MLCLDIRKDRLYINKPMYIQTTAQLLRLRKFVNENVAQISVPFIVQHGQSDMLCHWRSSVCICDLSVKVPAHRKKLILYKDCWHNIFHETEHEEAIQHAVNWMEDMLRALDIIKTLD